ncbi:MAG TPA: His/Gly/Thr/Pro-type tRNA ligase C-terminal domain-containing protein, partial [Kiritimatiellia bacterium]|nr:His/Gly/Thr/Pro-type tRNA ligase C-terminal domain-containing protein [Kiritimatiellia bacterium]
RYPAFWDESGAIGRRYRRQDEIGTPWCVTIDFQTLEDDTVTVRDRDSMQQERLTLEQLKAKLDEALIV